MIRILDDDPDDRVRAAAAQALGRFAYLASTGKLLERDGNRVSNALLHALDDRDESIEVRRRALEALASMSLEEVEGLIEEAYEDEDPRLRSSALYAMGRTCDERWLPTLLVELESDDPEMRYEAAIALGEIGREDVVPRLVLHFADADAQVQAASIGAIGAIGGQPAKAALRQLRTRVDGHLADLVEAALLATEIEEAPTTLPRHLRREA